MDIRKLCAALAGAISVVSLAGCASSADHPAADPSLAGMPSEAIRTGGAQPPASMIYHQAHSARLVALAAMPDTFAGSMHGWTRDSMPQVDRTLGVVSFNMKRAERRGNLALVAHHLAAEFDELPDFILCQEVMFRRGEDGEPASSAADLAGMLGYHVRGSTRRGDREGLAIISRYPFEYSEARHLQARSLPLIGWPRVSLIGEFLVPGVGRVRVVDVHFSHQPFEHGIRRRQMQETLQWVAQRDRECRADVTIFGGDLNTRPQWPELSLITEPQPGLELSLVNYNGDAPTKGGQGSWRHRIDYIFIAAPGHDIGFLGETLLWKDGLPARGGGRFWPSDHLLVHHEYAIMPRSQFAGVIE